MGFGGGFEEFCRKYEDGGRKMLEMGGDRGGVVGFGKV